MKAGPALEGVGTNARESLAAACALVASSPVPLGCCGSECTFGASAETSIGVEQQRCPADLPRLLAETPNFGPIARAYYEASYHNMQRGGPDILHMSLQPVGSAEVAAAGDPAVGERDRRGTVPSIRGEGLIQGRRPGSGQSSPLIKVRGSREPEAAIHRETESWQYVPQPTPSLAHDCFLASHGPADQEEEDGATDDWSRRSACPPQRVETAVPNTGASGALRGGTPDSMLIRGSLPSKANGGTYPKKAGRNGFIAPEADSGVGAAAIGSQKAQDSCAAAIPLVATPQSARPAMQQAPSGRNGGIGRGSSARTRSASMRRTTSSGPSAMRGSLAGIKRGLGSSGSATANMQQQQQQQQRAQPPTPRTAAALNVQASSTCRSPPKTARSDSTTGGARSGGQRLPVQGSAATVRSQVLEDDATAPSAADATPAVVLESSEGQRAAMEHPEGGGSPRRADSAPRSAASPQPRIAGLMSELGFLRDQVVDCRAEYELAKEQASQLENENAALKLKLGEVEHCSARLAQLEEENESLRRQLCETERCAAELRQRNHEVEADRDTWRGRWDQTHMKLEESWKQYDALQARWEETEEKVDAARRKREQDRKRLRQAEKLLQELGRCDSPAAAPKPCNSNVVSPGGGQASPVFGGTRG
mmetsp:Transcript_52871/g.105048  ORF Transcript_52871/g.105048 Transcript_52871/m.105048 type:complete len:651 (+) Transcript_52871:32-1984(+)